MRSVHTVVRWLAAAATLGVILAAGGAAAGGQHASASAGEAIYGQTCVACHGEDGTGTVPGAPDFTRQEGVLSKSDAVLLRHMKEGFKSPGSLMAMPPRGGNPELSDRDLRSALLYIQEAFGSGRTVGQGDSER